MSPELVAILCELAAVNAAVAAYQAHNNIAAAKYEPQVFWALENEARLLADKARQLVEER